MCCCPQPPPPPHSTPASPRQVMTVFSATDYRETGGWVGGCRRQGRHSPGCRAVRLMAPSTVLALSCQGALQPCRRCLTPWRHHPPTHPAGNTGAVLVIAPSLAFEFVCFPPQRPAPAPGEAAAEVVEDAAPCGPDATVLQGVSSQFSSPPPMSPFAAQAAAAAAAAAVVAAAAAAPEAAPGPSPAAQAMQQVGAGQPGFRCCRLPVVHRCCTLAAPCPSSDERLPCRPCRPACRRWKRSSW